MAAIPMEQLEALERKYHLSADGLTYQLRCSRIAAHQKGQPWEAPERPEVKRGTIEHAPLTRQNATEPLTKHPLFGVKLIITPKMVPDKNRAITFEEPVGHDIEVEEMSAGSLLYAAPEDVDRIVGDYKIIRENPNSVVMAKTHLPKTGQELSFTIGKDLVPVVEGNDGQRGYIWSLPPHMRQYGDTMIQLYGLKTLITAVAPELLEKFSGKPVMSYVDGLTLVASIPQTDAILKEYRRKELRDVQLGLG